MKAIILVGGEGTRLHPLTLGTSKTMVPLLNKPFLEHVIEHLKEHGITEIILTLCQKPYSIESYFSKGGKFGIHLSYILEDYPLGTAGAVKNAKEFLKDTFLTLNGDIFTDLDLTAMLDFHHRKKAKITIALTPVDNPTLYGLVETNGEGRVTKFKEKPAREQVTTNMVNAGFYILEPDVIDYIPDQTFFTFEQDLFPKLLAEDKPIFGYESSAYWIDIGTPEKYLQLTHDLLQGKSGRTQTQSKEKTLDIGKESFIHPEAEIKGPMLIGNGCTIEKRSQIHGPAVLGHGCKIGEEAFIKGSVLWQNVSIGRHAKLENCIIADNCRIRDDACIGEKAVLGSNVIVAKGVPINPHTKIMPETFVA